MLQTYFLTNFFQSSVFSFLVKSDIILLNASLAKAVLFLISPDVMYYKNIIATQYFESENTSIFSVACHTFQFPVESLVSLIKSCGRTPSP